MLHLYLLVLATVFTTNTPLSRCLQLQDVAAELCPAFFTTFLGRDLWLPERLGTLEDEIAAVEVRYYTSTEAYNTEAGLDVSEDSDDEYVSLSEESDSSYYDDG